MRELALYLVVYRDANHSSRNEMLVTVTDPALSRSETAAVPGNRLLIHHKLTWNPLYIPLPFTHRRCGGRQTVPGRLAILAATPSRAARHGDRPYIGVNK